MLTSAPESTSPFPVSSSKHRVSHISYVGGRMCQSWLNGDLLRVCGDNHIGNARWSINPPATLCLVSNGENEKPLSDGMLIAALDAAFAFYPEFTSLLVKAPIPSRSSLTNAGVIRPTVDGMMRADRSCLWQYPEICLIASGPSYALQYTVTEGQRHPLRPPKPTGVLYRRYIPWLQSSLSIRTVDIGCDLDRFHRWMNDPAIAEFWNERGSIANHRAYLTKLDTTPHAVSLIVCFDDEPAGYLEAYWAKEDRIGAHYDADNFDRGWHVLIGESRFHGRRYVSAWMPSMSHFLFLQDCRTQKLVIEPRIDNIKMSRSLAKCGYAHIKEIAFPHKRAMLGILWRERFFQEGLWHPRSELHD